jgi:hypothetical protein
MIWRWVWPLPGGGMASSSSVAVGMVFPHSFRDRRVGRPPEVDSSPKRIALDSCNFSPLGEASSLTKSRQETRLSGVAHLAGMIGKPDISWLVVPIVVNAVNGAVWRV